MPNTLINSRIFRPPLAASPAALRRKVNRVGSIPQNPALSYYGTPSDFAALDVDRTRRNNYIDQATRNWNSLALRNASLTNNRQMTYAPPRFQTVRNPSYIKRPTESRNYIGQRNGYRAWEDEKYKGMPSTRFMDKLNRRSDAYDAGVQAYKTYGANAPQTQEALRNYSAATKSVETYRNNMAANGDAYRQFSQDAAAKLRPYVDSIRRFNGNETPQELINLAKKIREQKSAWNESLDQSPEVYNQALNDWLRQAQEIEHQYAIQYGQNRNKNLASQGLQPLKLPSVPAYNAPPPSVAPPTVQAPPAQTQNGREVRAAYLTPLEKLAMTRGERLILSLAGNVPDPLKGSVLVNGYLIGKGTGRSSPGLEKEILREIRETPGWNRALYDYLNGSGGDKIPEILDYELANKWYKGPAKLLAKTKFGQRLVIDKIMDKTLPKIKGSTDVARMYLDAGGNV